MDTRNEDRERIGLKAVIIADTFTKLLEPLDENVSEVLLPLANIPLIEYMIDFLISNSIKEIIICAKKNNKSLETYLRKHHKKSKNFIKLITSDDFVDMGDCLRKISAEKLISTTEDFVLIRGLVITNIDLEKAIIFHKKKKEQDHNRILTCIMKNYKNDKDVRTKYDENILIYDKSTNRIVQYESTFESRKITANDNIQLKVSTNPNSKNPGENISVNYYKIRSDLYDSFIDICNGDILSRFDENFDHQSIRDDFIKNAIVSDVYTDTFYLYELSTEDYVGVIKNVDSYFKITHEILNRWAYPLTLEHITTSPSLEINYKAMNQNIYLDSDIRVDSKSKLVNSLALAKGVLVEEGCEISSSIIGKNSEVSPNSKIKNSIIFSKCQIGENVIIKNSIIGNKCIIDSGIEIKDCIIGDEVHITCDESEMRIYNSKDQDEEDEDLYGDNPESEDKEKKFEKIDKDTFLINLEDKDLLFVKKEETEEDQNQEEDESEDESSFEDEEEENYEELIETCIKSGIDKKTDIENILKEVFSLKDAIFEKTKAESTNINLIFYSNK